MKKLLVFDMDGTIADLYAVNDWKNKLNSSNPTPYMEAEPMWDMADTRTGQSSIICIRQAVTTTFLTFMRIMLRQHP